MLNRRGVALITVLFFILFIGILTRAILFSGPLMARVGSQISLELQAQRAAETGVTYARAQLKDKNDWKGDKNAVTVSTPDLIVEERDGNVIGWVHNAAGEVSLFRIRFNYQDGGAPGPDGLSDPPPAFVIDSPYVSLNNIINNGDQPAPRARSTSPWDVIATGPYDAPGHGAIIEVEGLAGRAVEGLTGPGQPGSGQLLRRVLRVTFAAAPSTSIADAAISAGGGIDAQMTQSTNVTIAGSGTAKIRTKKGIQVTKPDGSANLLDMNGEAGRDLSMWGAAQGLNATLAGTVTPANETIGDGKDFYNLKWKDVPVAATSGSVQLPGGVYVMAADGKVRYYDVDPTTFKTLDQTTGCTTITSTNFNEVRPPANLAVSGLNWDPSTFSLDVKNADLKIIPSANGKSDVLFTCPSGRAINGNDTAKTFVSNTVPASFYAPGSIQLDNATMSVDGNTTIMVDMRGKNGTLTAAGNAVVCAPSIDLQVDANITFNNRLSVYAKNDLTLSTWIDNPALPPYVPAYQGYGPLKLQGLIYSWGDATLYAGTPSQSPTNSVYTGYSSYGNVTIKGALVAYGADPVSGSPGSAGNGKFSIFGEMADIVYDPAKLLSGTTFIAGQPLPGLRRTGYGFENP